MDREMISLVRGVVERVVSMPVRDDELEDAALEIARIVVGGGGK